MQLINEANLAELEKSLGFNNLTDQARKAAHQDLINVISGRGTMRIIKNLSEAERQDFNAVATNATPQKVAELLLEKAPLAREIFQEELEKLKVELITE